MTIIAEEQIIPKPDARLQSLFPAIHFSPDDEIHLTPQRL